jgi:RNA polymerase sigma-70 factor, ECF subfamily
MVLESNDCKVIEGCQQGEPAAFRRLFEIHGDRIYSIALRFAGNEAVAMDIAQDTFLKLLSAIKDFRGDASFDAWLYRLVVNACIDNQRRTRRVVGVVQDFLDAICTSRETALHQLLRTEFAEHVQQAVATLSPQQRMVVVLRYTEGLSYEEIAVILNCSAGTVASRLNRAHKILERRLSHLRKA